MSVREMSIQQTETRIAYRSDQCIHELFEEQVARTPEAVAVVFRDARLTYRELSTRANRLAHRLQRLGVGPDTLVAIFMERSLEMMVALLGVLKAGGAYLPIDPAYPRERAAFILEDARVAVIITQHRLAGGFIGNSAEVVEIDAEWESLSTFSAECPSSDVRSNNLAYVIYTSGSTGKPKGVMVTHRNVVNFFTGMDRKIGAEPGVWLAVTSISFDISVLELFWTLARGFQVVIHGEEGKGTERASSAVALPRKTMEFSLFYFAGDEELGGDKYQLLIEGAKFADANGFTAVWSPERHFHAFGGMFPNPSLTSAALAMITKRVKIRAGSVVLPLHDPLRVAEEWSVVDNLSQGRAGVSFASGWHDKDFVFAPQNYAERKKIMFRDIQTVRALWRGETIQRRRGTGGEVPVCILPHPVQRELPVWVTASGDPGTFQMAGETGANLLTHLLGQSLDELAAKIATYRRVYSGEGQGHVTLMLHTYVGTTTKEVTERVREPFCRYLKTSVDLMKQVVKGLGEELQGGELSATDMESLVDHAFHRYFETSGLFGTPESCLPLIEKLKAIKVDEVACLIDFGVPRDAVLGSLENLRALMQRSNLPPDDHSGYSIPDQIVRHGVTHLQCTPSQMRMLLMTDGGPAALGWTRKLLLGGEALPHALAEDLQRVTTGEIFNMYGPTETTIWSTVHRLITGENPVPIGSPIANTSVHIVDENLEPVPHGNPGELLIGGDGVARGYLNRAELTAEKFIADPFSPEEGARLYRTGDLVRYLPERDLEFLGRVDHQVKIRGHRIELGEIEATLESHPEIRQAIVTVTDGADGAPELAAYVTAQGTQPPSVREIRQFLETKLPAQLAPTVFVFLKEFPLTPNGKIDRRRLPKPRVSPDSHYEAPRNALEEKLAAIWSEALRIDQVGVNDHFQELGGHSLNAVQITFAIRREFCVDLPLQALFDFPTIAGLAAKLEAKTWHKLAEEVTAEITPSAIRGELPDVGNGDAKRAPIN
jgi:natural product biosynthesis luciferase-like monooxygenase protein